MDYSLLSCDILRQVSNSEIFALLECCTMYIGSQLPMFQDHLSVANYTFMLHNIPEERISHLHCRGRLKSHVDNTVSEEPPFFSLQGTKVISQKQRQQVYLKLVAYLSNYIIVISQKTMILMLVTMEISYVQHSLHMAKYRVTKYDVVSSNRMCHVDQVASAAPSQSL